MTTPLCIPVSKRPGQWNGQFIDCFRKISSVTFNHQETMHCKIEFFSSSLKNGWWNISQNRFLWLTFELLV